MALVGAGLPAPEVNVSVHDERGGWLAEPDLSYPVARLAVEYQGAEHADPGRMRRDAARHMDLRRAGWDVLYYTAARCSPIRRCRWRTFAARWPLGRRSCSPASSGAPRR